MAWSPLQGAEDKPPRGSYSAAARAGDHIFVSGHVPVDPETGRVIGATVADQTNATLDRIAKVLEKAGSSLDDVVSVTAYLADIGDWNEFNEAYKGRFKAPFPTRTTVGAQLHGVLVEITVVAYVGS